MGRSLSNRTSAQKCRRVAPARRRRNLSDRERAQNNFPNHTQFRFPPVPRRPLRTNSWVEQGIDSKLTMPVRSDKNFRRDKMASDPPKVLISYSHDSPEHEQLVLELANRLRGDSRGQV